MIEDSVGEQLFANTKTIDDFYLQVSMLAGSKMKQKENTLIFIDEIQAYPHLLTLLKFLSQDDKFTFIASGSLLGVTLSQTTSIPMGSIRKVRMFPLDFEEFLYANGVNEFAVSAMQEKFERLEALDESLHEKITDLFRKYLLKLYLNDVGILTGILYGNNIRAVLDDEAGINLGSVYESVVAGELSAHGYKLFYYDNRSKGEVDYLMNDYNSLSAVPIEVKSGKNYTVHSALTAFVQNEDYHIKKAFVLSNTRQITTNGKITYIPIYYVMFFQSTDFRKQHYIV